MDSINERILAYDLATAIAQDEQEVVAISGGTYPIRKATLQPTTFNYMSFDLNLDH